jgi:hypothetical protein
MKAILLILVTLLVLSCSSSDDDASTSCNCDKVYYDYKVRLDGVKATWYYQKTYTEPTYCQDATGKYVQIGSNKYFKVECK